MKDDRLYLLHIRDCIDRVEEYTEAGRDAFLAETMRQDAVVRNLVRVRVSAPAPSWTRRLRRRGFDSRW